jgi:deferrochelatase/peroxidase EfeB
MNEHDRTKPRATRRGFLAGTAGLAAAGAGLAPRAAQAAGIEPGTESAKATEPFWGEHQSGIITPTQAHTYFAAFDLLTTKRDDVTKLLQQWTKAAALLTAGQPVDLPADGSVASTPDPADVLGLSPSNLTLTFGFGPQLFMKDGHDRYGLGGQRPAAFPDMPYFPGEQMEPPRTGGDLSVQACSDNPQVVFHAIRQLAHLAYGVAQIRWVQTGFNSNFGANNTPRNLMGFKDGTGNPSTKDSKEMDAVVWAGDEAPSWMRGGSYLVVRRARIALEHWDRMNVAFQEQTIGRQKKSGAPLGAHGEFDPVDLDAKDAAGNPVMPENSHVRLAHQAGLDGSRILRRAYSYNDGANVTAERWPPWHQGMEFDAGLLFICYQRDLRSGFIKIFEKMSRYDMMNQFITNTGGGQFACPGGAAEGEYIGQRLFEAAS